MSDDEKRCIPLFKSSPVYPYEFGDGFNISLRLIKLIRVFGFRRSAISCAGRIHKDKICLGEPSLLVVLHLGFGKRRTGGIYITCLDALGSKTEQVNK